MTVARSAITALPLAVAAVLAPAAAAAGEGGPAPGLEPNVSHRTFAALVERLGLDDDQRTVARMLYGDYAAQLEALSGEASRRADAAGRGKVEAALAGRIFIEPEELRRLRVGLARQRQEVWEEANHLATELLLNLRSLLPDEVDFDRAACAARRAMYLAPRRAAEQGDGYAGDGVDLVELAAAAGRDDGELAPLEASALAEVLEDYRHQVDRFLIHHAAADRRSRTDLAIARIQRDGDARRRGEAAYLARWQELYEIDRSAADRIGGIARSALGAEARQRWLDRFDRACFPRVYRSGRPDAVHAWIAKHITDEQARRREAETYAAFLGRRQALARAAVAIMLRGRIGLRAIVHTRMNSGQITDGAVRDLYEDLLKNSGERAHLEADTAAAQESLLSEPQRRQMKADLAAAAYGRRR